MSVVVTGSAGFIGRTLVETLAAAGERVIGIDRAPQPPRPGLTVLTADLLSDDDLVRAALEDAAVVYHLAGCPGVRDRGADVARRRRRDNVLAGARVLATVPRSVPVLVASSSSVYGGARGGRPSHETDPLRPVGGYARSKTALERLCAERLARGGRTTVIRPFTVAGEGQRPDMALSLWLAAAREGRPLRVLGSLDRTRDVTDVRQAARAMADLAAAGAQGAVNVGTGRGQSLRAMAAAVAEALDTEVSFTVEPAPAVEPGASLADVRRLRSLIGWSPETDLRGLVRRQAAAAHPLVEAT
ncbi:NAD-dependent epimerase/dehydratase family protein [Planomonospora venezuelensis]|uniref:Nucleoside-diphosphate-sugar epimerase n=1 Tax=Planomonospora venezuelensis TaxID=1999 RepID=A0A841D3N6_PLAVE|nr:nucleoside-diphosphate-sugar epimerase [Planomonospora venezuelensis]GIN00566.1 UDP-glucose 4-epimerase [Planomonospora venezuelensis]